MPKTATKKATKKSSSAVAKKTIKTDSKKKTPVAARKTKTPVSVAPITPSSPYPVALVILLIILSGLVYAYFKFFNIAVVNGRPVGRIEYYQTMEKQIGKQTLENLITEALILDTAAKNGITIDQSVIDQDIADIETRIKSQGQTLEEALSQEGMTRTDLEKLTRINKLIETLSATSSAVTDDQIAAFLETNKSQLPPDATPEELKVLATTQLDNQSKSDNMRKWLADIRATANIIYR